MAELDQNITTIRKVLEKCGLAYPVPESYKEYIRKNRRRFYIKLIKRTGHYTLWEGLTSYIYFGCTRFGLQLTSLQSSVAFIAASAMAVAVISTGGYFAVKIFVFDPVEIKPVQVEKTVNAAPVKETVKAKPRPKPFTLNLLIEGFGNIDKKTTTSISQKVKRYFIKNGISINKKYIVSGEIKAIEGNYYAKIRAFNNKAEQVHFKRETIKSLNDLEDFFIKESKKIAHKIK
ncbi:MAG: hypothetical protein GY754_36175 [bacterium]|nr:hypothetical protein [bacterium]